MKSLGSFKAVYLPDRQDALYIAAVSYCSFAIMLGNSIFPEHQVSSQSTIKHEVSINEPTKERYVKENPRQAEILLSKVIKAASLGLAKNRDYHNEESAVILSGTFYETKSTLQSARKIPIILQDFAFGSETMPSLEKRNLAKEKEITEAFAPAAPVQIKQLKRPVARGKNTNTITSTVADETVSTQQEDKYVAISRLNRSEGNLSVVGIFQAKQRGWALIKLPDGQLKEFSTGARVKDLTITGFGEKKMFVSADGSTYFLQVGDIF